MQFTGEHKTQDKMMLRNITRVTIAHEKQCNTLFECGLVSHTNVQCQHSKNGLPVSARLWRILDMYTRNIMHSKFICLIYFSLNLTVHGSMSCRDTKQTSLFSYTRSNTGHIQSDPSWKPKHELTRQRFHIGGAWVKNWRLDAI